MPEVEIRCPVGHQRLLLKLLLSGEKPTVIDDSLIEMACADCRKLLQSDYGIASSRVLHRYNQAGELVETAIEDSVLRERGR